MLRASSQGLGLPLSVIHVHRRVRLLEHVRAVWSTNVALTLGHGSQRTKDQKRRQNVQITQGIVEKENTEPDSALSNLLLYDAASPNTTQNSALHPARSKAVDSFLEELAASFPSVESHPPVVNTIGWNRNTMARKLVVVDAQTKGGGDICRKMLAVLGTTASPSEAWDAYTTLRHMIPDGYIMTGQQFIPFVHLHRLCRLLSASRPKNHMLFLRLLSILNYIRSTGGRIHRYEWNTVIDYAGRGWRKILPEDWETALSLYNDMVNGRTPGAQCHVQVHLTEMDDLHSVGAEPRGQVQLPGSDNLHAVQPDIFTFNILLDIAAETKQVSAVRHTLALMTEAGIDPNRMTFLILLKFHALSQQMSGVRSTVLRMKDQGHELGVDGINACMWAYGLNGRHDLVKSIYRLLRHNASPGEMADDLLLALSRDIEDEALICVPSDIRPDGATYTTVIQIMAYHGDLFTALNVLSDALACLPARPGPRLLVLNGVFRAIFLGFTKHGISPIQDERSLPPPLRISNPPGQPQWSLQNLQKVFDIFMNLPEDINASRTMLHWIMRAFDVTSGRDKVILQEVWKKLDKRFGMCWVASTNRLAAWRAMLFSETSGDVEPGASHGGLEDDFDIRDDG